MFLQVSQNPQLENLGLEDLLRHHSNWNVSLEDTLFPE
jgi:hypothetical protein